MNYIVDEKKKKTKCVSGLKIKQAPTHEKA